MKNLYKLYRVGDSVVRALDGVSFSVYEGEFCAIVGTSGSGKSTLLNMLAGLEKPTRGEVIVAGKHIEQMKENELVKFRGENVGFIFQSFHLMGTMNALENVALPLTFRGEPRKERIKKAACKSSFFYFDYPPKLSNIKFWAGTPRSSSIFSTAFDIGPGPHI